MTTVEPLEYEVYPTNYGQIPFSDKESFTYVRNGHAWGWSVRDFSGGQGRAMNRKGEFIHETRGNKGNRFRRYSLEEALELAQIWVDKRKRVGGKTAQEWIDSGAVIDRRHM